MYPDEYEKKVRIPIRIINGQVKYFYGGHLPRIVDGVIGELILPEYSIKDASFLEVMQRQESIELLPTGSPIMVAVSPHHIPYAKRNLVEPLKTVSDDAKSVYVLVHLNEPLKLQFRGSKKPKLEDTNCIIVRLNKESSSLNNAYTVISQEFEPQRRSHTGNVFKKCYYQENGDWFPLDRLREAKETVLEDAFFLASKRFFIHPDFDDFDGNDTRTGDEVLLVEALRRTALNSSEIKALLNDDGHRHIEVVNRLLVRKVIQEENK